MTLSGKALTALCGFLFPNKENSEFFEIFEALMNQLDSKIYANGENPHIILTGGGAITLDAGANTLTWVDDILLINLLTGGVITVVAGTLADFEDGKIAYVEVSRPVTGNKTATLAIVDTIGNDTDKLFIALRRGAMIYVRSDRNRAALATFTFWDASKITTASASSSGGSASGVIAIGVTEGVAWRTMITALSATADSTVRFFSDAGHIDELYLAENKNLFTTPHDDRVAWWIGQLTNGQLYYEITNDGGVASVYEIQIAGFGKMTT